MEVSISAHIDKTIDKHFEGVLEKDECLFLYGIYCDGSIYVYTGDSVGNNVSKNVDDLINELCSVRDELNRLKEEYGLDGLLKRLNDMKCGYIGHDYDVPFHDYETKRKDSIGE